MNLAEFLLEKKAAEGLQDVDQLKALLGLLNAPKELMEYLLIIENYLENQIPVKE